jgi:membrane protease YdiL (CAAX protease family)
MATSSRSSAIELPVVFCVWAAIVIATAFMGAWLGYSGPRFVVALSIAAALFGFELFLAVPPVLARTQRLLGGGSFVVGLVPLIAVVAYSSLVGGDWKALLGGVLYVVVPILLLTSVSGRAPGQWEDYAAVTILWVPVWLQWVYRVFPYPTQLTHVLSVLLALSIGIAGFLLLRGVDNVGYALEWRRGFAWNFGFHFLVLAAIAIPVGLRLHFLVWAPSIHRLQPLVIIGILFFTAWPEELLFRGLLQNLLSRTFANEWAALIVTSIIFGFSHILHAPAPNWKYVLLASIAGFFYGRAWMKTKSLVPGVIMHALVDICWHVLFR